MRSSVLEEVRYFVNLVWTEVHSNNKGMVSRVEIKRKMEEFRERNRSKNENQSGI